MDGRLKFSPDTGRLPAAPVHGRLPVAPEAGRLPVAPEAGRLLFDIVLIGRLGCNPESEIKVCNKTLSRARL